MRATCGFGGLAFGELAGSAHLCAGLPAALRARKVRRMEAKRPQAGLAGAFQGLSTSTKEKRGQNSAKCTMARPMPFAQQAKNRAQATCGCFRGLKSALSEAGIIFASYISPSFVRVFGFGFYDGHVCRAWSAGSALVFDVYRQQGLAGMDEQRGRGPGWDLFHRSLNKPAKLDGAAGVFSRFNEPQTERASQVRRSALGAAPTRLSRARRSAASASCCPSVVVRPFLARPASFACPSPRPRRAAAPCPAAGASSVFAACSRPAAAPLSAASPPPAPVLASPPRPSPRRRRRCRPRCSPRCRRCPGRSRPGCRRRPGACRWPRRRRTGRG